MTEQEAMEYISDVKKDEMIDEFFYADDIREAFDMAIKALEYIQQYRALGTVEELRVARDKQVAKKPKSVNNEYGTFDCPSCGHTIIALDDMTIHQNCLLCGQELDWSDEDDD